MKQGCCNDKACNRDTCMNIPHGETCGDCQSALHCITSYGKKRTDTACDWFPRRFREIEP